MVNLYIFQTYEAHVHTHKMQQNAANIRYIFSKTKSKVIYIPDKTSKGTGTQPLRFKEGEIRYSQKEIHIGLARTADGKSTMPQ